MVTLNPSAAPTFCAHLLEHADDLVELGVFDRRRVVAKR